MRIQIAMSLILLVLTEVGCSQKDSVPADVQKAMDNFSKSAFRSHMNFLADDLFEGRFTGTRGQELAAKYVASEFEALGLEPGGENGTYFQTVPLREISTNRDASSVAVTQTGKTTQLKWAEDFVLRGDGRELDAIVEAPVVFVGFGVVDAGRNYDDYAGLDVSGKIVAYLYGAPQSLPSEERAHFTSALEKQRQAASRGAVGVITLATPEREKLLPWTRTVYAYERPAMRWLDTNGEPNDVFKEIRVSAFLSASTAQRLFAAAPKSWEQILKEAEDDRPQGFALPYTIKMHAVSTHRNATSPNVVGMLRGSDSGLAKEYVAYVAHTDHLGISTPVNGDAIYNGARDDASGTAALIEIAKAFTSLPNKPARSMLFLGVTGEELGLLGSDYFAHFPTVPPGSIAVDLNMDVPSILFSPKDMVLLGLEHTSLVPAVSMVASSLGFQISPDPTPEQGYFTRKDLYSFVRQGIPSIDLAEGLQARDPKVDGRSIKQNWIATRYHAPSDDMSQPFDFDAAIQYMKFGFLVGYTIAQQQQRPQWADGDFFGKLYGGNKPR